MHSNSVLSPISRLHADILTYILSSPNLSYQDLLCASLVNKQWNSIAQPIANSIYDPRTTFFCGESQNSVIEEYSLRDIAVRNTSRYTPGQPLRSFHGQSGRINKLKISSDMQRIASLTDNHVVVWDASSTEVIAFIDASGETSIGSIAFTRSGKYLLCGGLDNVSQTSVVIVVEMQFGETIGKISMPWSGEVMAMALSNNDEILVCGLSSGEGIQLYRVGFSQDGVESVHFRTIPTNAGVSDLFLVEDPQYITFLTSTHVVNVVSMHTGELIWSKQTGFLPGLVPATPALGARYNSSTSAPLLFTAMLSRLVYFDMSGSSGTIIDVCRWSSVYIEHLETDPTGRILFFTTDTRRLFILDMYDGSLLFVGWVPARLSAHKFFVRNERSSTPYSSF